MVCTASPRDPLSAGPTLTIKVGLHGNFRGQGISPCVVFAAPPIVFTTKPDHETVLLPPHPCVGCNPNRPTTTVNLRYTPIIQTFTVNHHFLLTTPRSESKIHTQISKKLESPWGCYSTVVRVNCQRAKTRYTGAARYCIGRLARNFAATRHRSFRGAWRSTAATARAAAM